MIGMRYPWAVALMAAALVTPTWAIEVGDPAPPLKVQEWVKGGPVDLKEGKGKNIYVVEFWAVWCGPCKASIPHLTAVQKKYKDKGVVIIGVSSSDRSLADVKKYVKQQGAKMDYVVAYEDQGRAETAKAYMEAFGIKTIPHAFVVDREGRLAWQGHPDRLGQTLDQILAGKYDLEKEKGKFAEERQRARNREKAMALMERYFSAATDSKNVERANKLAGELLPLIEKDADLLAALSWQILTNPTFQHRDLELALKAAKMAADLTEGKDADKLDTYARALWDTGRKQQAVETQRKAVGAATDADIKAELEKTLQAYEEKLSQP